MAYKRNEQTELHEYELSSDNYALIEAKSAHREGDEEAYANNDLSSKIRLLDLVQPRWAYQRKGRSQFTSPASTMVSLVTSFTPGYADLCFRKAGIRTDSEV